jgi:hypothetical protein
MSEWTPPGEDQGDVVCVQDRVAWIGDPEARPRGSSGKVREIRFDQTRGWTVAEVDWGGRDETWCVFGSEVVSCVEAGRQGVEPWVGVYERAVEYGSVNP